MKKLQKISVMFVLTVCLFTFGAWTYNTTAQRYADVQLVSTYTTTTVNYTSKDDSVYKRTAGNTPCYISLNDMTNACGAVAGAEIVAYYDKYFENLIPDWVSYYPKTGKYRLQDSTYVPAVMRELYTLMRTNVDDVGVSESDFKDGLKKYINNHGYNVSYQNVVSGSSIDYNACKQAIDNNKIIALLTRACEIYEVGYGNGHDTIVGVNITGSHIMVAYGYQEIRYYNESGLFRTDLYLDVATGWSLPETSYYKVNPHNLNAAYIVNIS